MAIFLSEFHQWICSQIIRNIDLSFLASSLSRKSWKNSQLIYLKSLLWIAATTDSILKRHGCYIKSSSPLSNRINRSVTGFTTPAEEYVCIYFDLINVTAVKYIEISCYKWKNLHQTKQFRSNNAKNLASWLMISKRSEFCLNFGAESSIWQISIMPEPTNSMSMLSTLCIMGKL